jgi:hypothetical protein
MSWRDFKTFIFQEMGDDSAPAREVVVDAEHLGILGQETLT